MSIDLLCWRRTSAWSWTAVYIAIASSGAHAAMDDETAVVAVLCAEAGNQGERGMTAVAEVIHQRAVDGRKSILTVLTKRKAFSCLNGTSLENLDLKFRRAPEYAAALRIAKIACRHPEKLPGLARGANHFTHKREKPWWAKGRKPVVIIGDHAFFRL